MPFWPRSEFFHNAQRGTTAVVPLFVCTKKEQLFPAALLRYSFLLGAVDAVACVAQTGDDVAILVQVVVLCAEVDVHIGVCLVQGLREQR